MVHNFRRQHKLHSIKRECILHSVMVKTILRRLDSPISWMVIGFAIGFGLGVNSTSVWLLTAGLGLFIVYLQLHGPAKEETEGRLFSVAPLFIISWIVGFIVHNLVF